MRSDKTSDVKKSSDVPAHSMISGAAYRSFDCGNSTFSTLSQYWCVMCDAFLEDPKAQV
jgi:hypothetical protein